MCYAIPGKIIEIEDNIVTIDYFGEKKRARNDFYKISCGDYVYAQGGFVIQKLPLSEALEILKTWEEFFFKLKEIDLRLARKPKTLYERANLKRKEHLGNACCIHGIIEFSNYCRNNCLYCGLRRDNTQIKRFRMDIEEIVKASRYAASRLNFKALVLQSGEDLWYSEEKMIRIIKNIMENTPLLLILSIGEREVKIYEALYKAGARGVLLRFETSNPLLYQKYRPGHQLKKRLGLIKALKEIGYLIFTGFLIGLPGQSERDILNDIELTGSLAAEMFSFGPFIPHPHTPLADSKKPSIELVLTTIARTRIMYPSSRILATTALQTLDLEHGLKRALLSGANSLMVNLTPKPYQKLYDIYPRSYGRASIEEEIDATIKLLHTLGRAPTDLGL